MSVEVGQEAPDFELQNQFGAPVRLSSFRGEKNVGARVLPEGVHCDVHRRAVRDPRREQRFENDDTVVFGISCDTTATLKVFAEQEHYEFALLSDFWPHGAVSQAYGAFFDKGGFPLRATFIIDKAGVVRWSVVNSPADARRTSDYREALAAL